jgi:uncharacterized protein YycO
MDIRTSPHANFNNLAPGLIGLTQIAGSWGRAIAFGEHLDGSPKGDDIYSHAFITLGGTEIVEAEPNGARIGSVTEYTDGRPLFVSSPELTEDKGEAIADRATLLIGTPYGFLDYLAIAFHHWHLPGLKFIAARSSSMICSTLAVFSYKDEGIDLFPELLPGYVTPAMLGVRLGAV